MTECKLKRTKINSDKDLIKIIAPGIDDIYIISSTKWQTAYIHKNDKKYYIEKDGYDYNLICHDKQGFRQTYHGINRFMINEKLKKQIDKLLISLQMSD